MSARLVHGHRRAGRARRRVPRAGPRGRAVPSRAAGHPRPADRDGGSRSWTVSPTTELDLGLPSVPDARRAAGRPRRHRRVAARPTAARCSPTTGWPGCEKPCASSVFTCPGWTCGRTPTCTRRWSPSCWRGPACTPDYRVAVRAGTRRAAGRRTGHPPPADSATTPNCPSWRARNSTSSRPPRAPSTCSVRRRCRTTSSRCASRCRTCSRRRSC